MNSLVQTTPAPREIARLPVDPRGYPIPWFVAYFNGKPDFRVPDPQKVLKAMKQQRCYICGGPLGTRKTFVFGPASVIQYIAGEPPSHLTCAVYAVQVCPWLALPRARRRESNMPDLSQLPVSVSDGKYMIQTNPGISALTTVKRYAIGSNADGSLLLHLDGVESVEWWRERRLATRAEVASAFESAREELIARKRYTLDTIVADWDRAMSWLPDN